MDVEKHRTTMLPRLARWRGRKMRRAIASLLFAGGTITNGNTPLHAQGAQALPAAAAVGSVSASILQVVAPSWLVKLLNAGHGPSTPSPQPLTLPERRRLVVLT
jgi:hypothetical protein